MSRIDRAWRPRDEARLRALYPCTRTSELPALLGRTRSAIKNRAAALHLRKERDASMRRPWAPDEDAVIRRDFPHSPTRRVAISLRRSESSTTQRAKKLGVMKTPKYLASADACRLRRGDNVGARFRYPKGHTPANKGTRSPGFHRGRMRETWFKPGTLNGRAAKIVKPVGAERINADGYLDRKVNNGLPRQRRWRAVHVLTWEAAHGPVPQGHAIVFINGNKRDIRLENLECVSRAELALRNSVHNLPKPIAQAYQLVGAVRRQINRRTREKQDRRSA